MDWDEKLLAAAKKGSTIRARIALFFGADINARDKNGATALVPAIEQGNGKMVRFLIEKGADVNARNRYENTPIILAAEYGNKEIVQFLIEKGADINAKNDRNWTALIIAACRGQTSIAELLIKKGADINAKNDLGRTVLYWAAHNRNNEIFRMLLERGVYFLHEYKNDHSTMRVTNEIAERNPELFTEKQKIVFRLYSNPEEYPPERKGELVVLLRDLTKEGLLTKKEALGNFHLIMGQWNRKTEISTTAERIRKPEKKPDGKNLKRMKRMV